MTVRAPSTKINPDTISQQLKEIFGAGTACVVAPVDRILYLDEVSGP